VAKKITFAFGRFNPVTIGHEVLMNKAASVGGKDYRIYISHSQDRKKNPLDFKTKLKYMKKIFPAHAGKIQNSKMRTAIEVAVELHDEGYTDLIMIAGSDRVGEFQKLLDEYNGVKGKRHGFYKFDSIKVISAGERDPDADGASGMSASKMRAAAQDDDLDKFKQGLPPKFANSPDATKLFRAVQKAMGVKSMNEWYVEGVFGRTIKKKGYIAAVVYYKKFIQRGDKPANAIHKAASMIQGLNDRDLKLFLQKNKVL
jgi:hypothetical protein